MTSMVERMPARRFAERGRGEVSLPDHAKGRATGGTVPSRAPGPIPGGALDDGCEREANALADRASTHRLSARSLPLGVGRPVSTEVEGVLRAPGRPLLAEDRAVMESHFAHDFQHVRIHDDAVAAASARSLRAHAYTVGHHIVTATPLTGKGTRDRRLLAHELAHVLQQGAFSTGSEGPSPRSSWRVQCFTPPGHTVEPGPLVLRPDDEGKPPEEMSWSELQAAIDEQQAFMAEQTSTTPGTVDREARLAALEAAQKKLAAQVTTVGAPKRKGTNTSKPALPARPESLMHSIEWAKASPQRVNAELDRVVAYIAAGPPKAERELLELALSDLERAAGAAREKKLETARHEKQVTALSPITGTEAEQLTEMLHRLQDAQPDPSRKDIWLIHHDGLVFPLTFNQLVALRESAASGLLKGAHAVNGSIHDVKVAWRERHETSLEHPFVHDLAKFTGGVDDTLLFDFYGLGSLAKSGDISPGEIARMEALGDFYVRRVMGRVREGKLVLAGDELLVLAGFAQHWAEKVGAWESKLMSGARNWAIALTIVKESLGIMAGFSAARLAAAGGGGFLGVLKTGGKIATLTTATGAVAGGFGSAITGHDVKKGIRIGTGEGFGVGAQALTAATSRLASIHAAAKGSTTLGKAYLAGKAVTLDAVVNVATNITQAAIEDGNIGDAALGALASSPIHTIFGALVHAYAPGRTAQVIGYTIVGGFAGGAGATASGGGRTAGVLSGAAGGFYSSLASRAPAPATADDPTSDDATTKIPTSTDIDLGAAPPKRELSAPGAAALVIVPVPVAPVYAPAASARPGTSGVAPGAAANDNAVLPPDPASSDRLVPSAATAGVPPEPPVASGAKLASVGGEIDVADLPRQVRNDNAPVLSDIERARQKRTTSAVTTQRNAQEQETVFADAGNLGKGIILVVKGGNEQGSPSAQPIQAMAGKKYTQQPSKAPMTAPSWSAPTGGLLPKAPPRPDTGEFAPPTAEASTGKSAETRGGPPPTARPPLRGATAEGAGADFKYEFHDPVSEPTVVRRPGPRDADRTPAETEPPTPESGIKSETGMETEQRELASDAPNREARPGYFAWEGGGRRTFSGFAKALRNYARKFAVKIPSHEPSFLKQSARKFIEKNENLRPLWEAEAQALIDGIENTLMAMRQAAGDNVALGKLQNRIDRLQTRLAKLNDWGNKPLGTKRPDLIEAFFVEARGAVTDITQRPFDPSHNFKTAFYVEVVKVLTDWSDVSGNEYHKPLRQNPLE